MEISGKVVYIDLSGGFWGLLSDTGEKFTPIEGVPGRFQKDGLKIRATLEPSNLFSIYMWGQNVIIKEIKAA